MILQLERRRPSYKYARIDIYEYIPLALETENVKNKEPNPTYIPCTVYSFAIELQE